ncbi:hypothetical protein [uncultured Tenacibaculum sp.]|uniref:hypothetical protein n=1 Tax=uncultured Tenacibaculum sp. TaxID=174713 RepID=UPI00261A2FED|nr:hypothetical protein [uncultured Tenacibaculum sp.]
MKLFKTIFLTLVTCFACLILFFFISNSYVLPWEKEEAIETTIKWGGLNELPKDIKNLKIDKRGSIFTRQFIIEFEVNHLEQINYWIHKSKRLKDNTPTIDKGKKIFLIYPGEQGANGGKVEIHDKEVKINMSWS